MRLEPSVVGGLTRFFPKSPMKNQLGAVFHGGAPSERKCNGLITTIIPGWVRNMLLRIESTVMWYDAFLLDCQL